MNAFPLAKIAFSSTPHMKWKTAQKKEKGESHEKGVNVTANQASQQNENFLLSNGA